jgi:hypothetical protein
MTATEARSFRSGSTPPSFLSRTMERRAISRASATEVGVKVRARSRATLL